MSAVSGQSLFGSCHVTVVPPSWLCWVFQWSLFYWPVLLLGPFRVEPRCRSLFSAIGRPHACRSFRPCPHRHRRVYLLPGNLTHPSICFFRRFLYRLWKFQNRLLTSPNWSGDRCAASHHRLPPRIAPMSRRGSLLQLVPRSDWYRDYMLRGQTPPALSQGSHGQEHGPDCLRDFSIP